MAVSLQDVADAAGVSIATASRALGGKTRVSAKTTQHVRDVADRLGYRVNVLGKALREGSDGVVGIVVPMVSNPFYASLLHEFEDQLERVGLKLLIADSRGELDLEIARLDALSSRRVRGIFVVPAYFEQSRPAIARTASQVPLVQVDRRVDRDDDLAFVGVDNAGGIEQLLRHVQSMGASDVVYVGADDRTSGGRERRRAFDETVGALGLTAQRPIIDRYLFEFGVRAANTLLRRSKLPDAVIAADDLIATGVLSAFHRRGVQVPSDVMVTGFDGTIIADICSPMLTTARQPMTRIAEEAVALLLHQLDHDEPASDRHVRLPSSLRAADSTDVRAGSRATRPT